MSIFSEDETQDKQLDWSILRHGGICLYWRQEILTDDLNWLKSNGYKIVSFDATEWQSTSEWESERKMHESFKTHLSFPDYYGMNLDALDECISDDLVVPDTGGMAIVLNRYDRVANCAPHHYPDSCGTAEVVLSIFARAVRHHMLFGRRLLILVQSDDPEIQFGRLGGVAASWNYREWLNSSRGV